MHGEDVPATARVSVDNVNQLWCRGELRLKVEQMGLPRALTIQHRDLARRVHLLKFTPTPTHVHTQPTYTYTQTQTQTVQEVTALT